MSHSYRGMFLGLLALTLTACNSQEAAPAGMGGQMPATKVTVVEMKPGPVTLTSEMAGRTVSYLRAEVRPEVGGIIRERRFQEGSDVQAGDVLYLIEPDSYQAAYDSAKAALAKADASLSVSKLKDDRTSQLFKTNSVSRQDYDDARSAYLQAQAEVAACKAALRTAEINLDRTKVRAPISGRIGKSSVSVGALVTADQAAALATIHQTSPMNVDLTQAVDELRAMRAQVGAKDSAAPVEPEEVEAKVQLVLSDGTPYEETGTLRFADVGVDEGTGTVTVRAEFPNAQHELLPGMFVRAVVEMGAKNDALLVPQRAVLRDSRGMPFVFVAVPGAGDGLKAERRGVALGAPFGDAWLALDGLKPGDKVILGGAHNVRNDGPVTVVDDPDLAERGEAAPGQATADAGATDVAGGQA